MGDQLNDAAPEQMSGSWRRGWASAGAIIATLFLVGLVIMVTLTNRARDNALAWERHTQDVMLMARTVDATIARSEAALGRYVLDEEPTTGLSYYGEWRLAGRQIGRLHQLVRTEPEQRTRVDKLRKLYDERGARTRRGRRRRRRQEGQRRRFALLPGRQVEDPARAAPHARRDLGRASARTSPRGSSRPNCSTPRPTG